MRKLVFGVSRMSDTKRSVSSQQIGRCFKFGIKEEDGLYCSSSENKGADQLCSYCTADMRFCFCIGKNLTMRLISHLLFVYSRH